MEAEFLISKTVVEPWPRVTTCVVLSIALLSCGAPFIAKNYFRRGQEP